MTSSIRPLVSTEAITNMCAHARRDYPKECCGIVFGPTGSDVADEARPCENTQDLLHAEDPVANPRDARTAYNFGARDLFLLGKSLRGPRPAKIIYHSHANVGAYFSDTDQAAAKMGDEPAYPVDYVVVDVQADGTHGAVQFAWDAEARQYVEVRRYP